MINSPLGQYAPKVAAITCGGTVLVYLLALVFGAPLGVTPTNLSALHDVAVLALGAIIGSAVAVNGWKQPLESVHKRVDALELATNTPTHTEEPK